MIHISYDTLFFLIHINLFLIKLDIQISDDSNSNFKFQINNLII